MYTLIHCWSGGTNSALLFTRCLVFCYGMMFFFLTRLCLSSYRVLAVHFFPFGVVVVLLAFCILGFLLRGYVVYAWGIDAYTDKTPDCDKPF